MKHDLIRCLARDRKSPPQRRSLFDKQRDLNGTLLEVNKIQLIIIIYQQSSHLGRHATLCRHGLKCQQKFALKKFTILTRACRFHFAFASK